MAEKAILFNTEMVRAILEGRKTVTRRVVKPQPGEDLAYIWGGSNHGKWCFSPHNESRYEEHRTVGDWKYWTPPFHAGDILWVRETWGYDKNVWLYKADFSDEDLKKIACITKWHPSIHMPREAARIFLRVTDVRVERLQEITIAGLQEEGMLPDGYISQYTAMTEGVECFDQWKLLWDSTIKPADRDRYGWAANPWVWVIDFERTERSVTST